MSIESKGAGVLVKDTPRSSLVLLQSLRGIAALFIVALHIQLLRLACFPQPRGHSWLSACESGVDLFFVISGFIMMHIVPRAHRSWKDQALFLFRRAARIYPPYWAMAVPLLLIWCWDSRLINGHFGNQVDVVSSLLLSPTNQVLVLSVAWSLVAEVSYYLVTSFIFYFEGKIRLWALLLWFAIILGYSINYNPVSGNAMVATYLRTLTLEFIAGMLLANFLMHQHRKMKPQLAAPIILMTLAVIFFWGKYHGPYYGHVETLSRVMVYGTGAVIIVGTVLQLNIQGDWKWLEKLAPIGDRSYALYLVHFPLLGAFYRLAGGTTILHRALIGPILEACGVVVILSLGVEILHRLIERPSHEMARQLANYFTGKKFVPASVANVRDASRC